LLKGQPLGSRDDFRSTEPVANARTEQLAENCYVEMPMNASPTSALKVVPAKFFLGFTKADFDHRPCESHS
jgi:hypothetical protein